MARHVVFEPAMQQRAARRGGLEAGLRRALAGDGLFVAYRPVVGLQGPGGIDRSAGAGGAGAIPRGVVPPIELIGVVEEYGLIDAVGDVVLRTAARQFMQWQCEPGACAPRLLAVNPSRARLAHPGLVGSVGNTLRAGGMPAVCLQLEVTESLAAQDEAVQARLHRLQALGLTLTLDDVGTGYPSLASLHQLPGNTVKIDRSFVSQADTARTAGC